MLMLKIDPFLYLSFAVAVLLLPLRLVLGWIVAVLVHECCHYIALKIFKISYNNKKFEMLFSGNLDLYWVIERLDDKDTMYEVFSITKVPLLKIRWKKNSRLKTSEITYTQKNASCI